MNSKIVFIGGMICCLVLLAAIAGESRASNSLAQNNAREINNLTVYHSTLQNLMSLKSEKLLLENITLNKNTVSSGGSGGSSSTTPSPAPTTENPNSNTNAWLLNFTALATSPNTIQLYWAGNFISGDLIRIEKSKNGINWTTLDFLNPNQVSAYANHGLDEGTTYYYHMIKFYNQIPSGPSPVISATTPYYLPNICTDTDNEPGQSSSPTSSYFIKGTMQNQSSSGSVGFTDFCSPGSNKLYEYSCTNGGSIEEIECQFGCSNGACLPEQPEEPKPSCEIQKVNITQITNTQGSISIKTSNIEENSTILLAKLNGVTSTQQICPYINYGCTNGECILILQCPYPNTHAAYTVYITNSKCSSSPRVVGAHTFIID